MRQKIKSNNLLKCSGFFLEKEHISRSSFRVKGPALLPASSPQFPANADVTEEGAPSLSRIPKRRLDFILYYLTLQHIEKSKRPHSTFFTSYKRNRHFIFQYHKNFQLIRRLKGSALCLLQTQYAKKPKNPE